MLTQAFGKMALIELLYTGLFVPDLQFVQSAVSAQHNKVKHNKMRCACIYLSLNNKHFILTFSMGQEFGSSLAVCFWLGSRS